MLDLVREPDLEDTGATLPGVRGRPFQPGQSGNPAGRPRGARNRATLLIEALLEGEAEEIGRKLIELAKGGDRRALKICLDRLSPARRGCPVSFDMPPIEAAADLPKATAALLAAVAAGEVAPSEALKLTRVVETHVRALELRDLELEKEPARTEEERGGEAKVPAATPPETRSPQSQEPEGEPGASELTRLNERVEWQEGHIQKLEGEIAKLEREAADRNLQAGGTSGSGCIPAVFAASATQPGSARDEPARGSSPAGEPSASEVMRLNERVASQESHIQKLEREIVMLEREVGYANLRSAR